MNELIRSISLGLAVVTLLIADNWFFPLSHETRRVIVSGIGLAFLLLWWVIGTQPKNKSESARIWGTLFLLVIGVLFFSPTRSCLVLWIVLFLQIVSFFRKEDRILAALGGGSGIYFGLSRISELAPMSRVPFDYLASLISNVVSAGHDGEAVFSTGTLGFGFWLLIWSFLFSSYRFLKLNISLLLSVAVLTLPIPTCLLFKPEVYDKSIILLRSLTWTFAALIVFFAVCFFIRANVPNDESITRKPANGRARTWAVVLFATGVLCGLSICSFDTFLSPPTKHIAIHNRGGLDWKRPTFEKPGGMFGELPFFLLKFGYNVSLIDEDYIEQSSIKDAQILILINSAKDWDESELLVVDEFVKRGGTLLVFGDHTNVFGLQDSLNQVTGRYGIEFKFDSGYYLRSGWRGCLSASSSFIEGVWEEHSPGIAIGASLNLFHGARPLVVGRYGHSDDGVKENVVGSFLGNYKYEPGEQAGDISLVATNTIGRGRVVVFGDTSTLQGGITRRLKYVVLPLLDWCSRPAGFLENRWVKTGLSLAVLAALFGLTANRVQNGLALTCGFAIAFTASFLITPSHDPLSKTGHNTVLIANCNVLNVGHYNMDVNAIGPLYSLIAKSGLHYYELNRWKTETVENAKAIVFVAPTKPIVGTQLEDIVQYEENGGIILVAAGHDHLRSVAELLRQHNLVIENRPMGTVTHNRIESAENRRFPRLLDAWPIESTNSIKINERRDVKVLLEYSDEACVVFCRKGLGGLLLISDSRFFSTRNIEKPPYFEWEGNIQFVRHLFIEFLHIDPDSVTDYFPSPELPE